ncbi:MAG: hypothetical protein V1745_00180 [Patescibacteria group bacterium]
MVLFLSASQRAWEDAVEAFLNGPEGQGMLDGFTPEMLTCLCTVLSAMILPPRGSTVSERQRIASYADTLVKTRLEKEGIHVDWIGCAKKFRDRIRERNASLFDAAFVAPGASEPPRVIKIVEIAALRIKNAP